MKQSNQIPLLLTIAAIVFSSCVSVHAQDSTVQPESRHILILNNKGETFKTTILGDEIRVVLVNKAISVMGQITSIDSTFFTVDTNVVHLHEIEKISTKKRRVQMFLGGVLIAGGIATYAVGRSEGTYTIDGGGGIALLGLIMTAVGVGTMLPGYHKIGKSKFLLISNQPID